MTILLVHSLSGRSRKVVSVVAFTDRLWAAPARHTAESLTIDDELRLDTCVKWQGRFSTSKLWSHNHDVQEYEELVMGLSPEGGLCDSA